MLYIHHATILTPHTTIPDGAILIDRGRIVAVGPGQNIPRPEDIPTIDATGLTLVPGFIDLQLNGGFGHDFTQNPETIWTVAAKLPQTGVTTFLPTIITSPLHAVEQAQKQWQEGRPASFGGAEPMGLHLEGPFLHPNKKGAHNPRWLRRPSLEAIRSWTWENGIRLVTLAPELPQALDLITVLASRGIIVSAGHSQATLEEATTGFNAGIRYATHLFNAMTAMHHREPGLVAAALSDPRLIIGILPDGIHVHPHWVKLAWQLTGPNRLNLVTDAMAALLMPPGTYYLADQTVIVDETGAHLADGTLAGSVISMDQALRNLMAYTGCSLKEALPTVTSTPADLLGLGQRKGTIAPNYDADLVLLDVRQRVQKVLLAGEIIYSRD
ncbi:MAG: N-acetylglucosamine-6-phosphate deacetylase [Chloroflexi bacterium]|nr:N-acetylglucosamine-6-phosphate deacetylase [Chloroflexota bacterium]MBP8054251.1 N-acetylglucosamine-6-phosphate deacetylase [Chloroflexota bacterium]